MLLNVVRILRIHNNQVKEEEIRRAASHWASEAESKSSKRIASFEAAARGWCRFSGSYRSNAARESSRFKELNAFTMYLQVERRYLPSSVVSCGTTARLFLRCLATRHKCLSAVRMADVESFLEAGRSKGWRPQTTIGHARALRVFFKFAETHALCTGELSRFIKPPRRGAALETQNIPTWQQVRSMLSSLDCSRPSHCRAKAILLLASIYGLRLSEIVHLSLDDLDWENRIITITRSKRGRVQQFPLQEEVGAALMAYITGVRPATQLREVFLTLNTPIRLATHLGPAMRRVMIAQHCFDWPLGLHSLRHACATELLRSGTSLRGISEFLGHRGARSVSIYAHCDSLALLRVSSFCIKAVL